MIPRIGDIIMLREYQFSKVAKKNITCFEDDNRKKHSTKGKTYIFKNVDVKKWMQGFSSIIMFLKLWTRLTCFVFIFVSE